jgi:hypothetical protein
MVMVIKAFPIIAIRKQPYKRYLKHGWGERSRVSRFQPAQSSNKISREVTTWICRKFQRVQGM